METRESIEAILDQAYGARERGDAEGAADCFAANACFMANAHTEGNGAP